MKVLACIFYLMLGICFASRWKLDRSCSQYSQAIETAFAEALDLAGNGYTVMQNHYDTDVHIQQMVKYILGDDSNLRAKIGMVKATFQAVSRYERTSYPFLGSPFQTNEDLIIFCDGSNYEAVNSVSGTQSHRNKVIRSIVGKEHWDNFESCHASSPSGGQAPMGITMSSDRLDLRGYTDELNIWTQMGGVGEPPKDKDFRRPQEGKPNTMDLCVWYLNENRNSDWPKVNKEMVEKVRDESFILGLRNNDKPVDTLSTTLGATLLHELTHTNVGGGMMDQGNGNCYGWVCVGNLKDASNPDSVNMLGVVLKLWSMGFYVNEAGRVESRTG